jgi:hypothetical protein
MKPEVQVAMRNGGVDRDQRQKVLSVKMHRLAKDILERRGWLDKGPR